MNAVSGSIQPRDLQLRALCLAIAIALSLPVAALAQDDQAASQATPAPASQTEPEQAEKPASNELFSIADSDDPDRLKDLLQIHNTVEFGAFYVSDDSFRFGRYSGLNEQGVGAVLNLDILHRGAYDSDSAAYWSLKASNLGLDSREIQAEFGVQGKYKIRVDYDQIPIFRSDSARTIFDGAGSDNLTLPSNWVGAGTTAGMTQLVNDLKPVELKTVRRQTGIAFGGILSRHWNFTSSYKRETKDGTKSIGAVFGNSGGNPRSSLVPEPVDYTTQQIDLGLNYTTRKFQFEAAYYLSLFSDANKSLVWSNPFTTISGWAPGTGFPTARGQLSLPPDNQFHQVSLNIGYNFTDRTRFSGSVARGRMTQDDTFLPYTDIASLAASITQPLPRDSLEGRIDTTVVNLRISSRPWTDFSWNASYRYDDRDNKTPRDVWVYIGGDSQFQDTSVASNHRRFNEPYSFKEQQFKTDASYRVFGHTELSAGFERSKIDRTYLEREQADEDTWNFGLNTEITERFSGHLRYTHAHRDGSTYVGTEPFFSGYSPGYTSTVAAGFENLPGLRRFFEADRKRDQVTAMASFTPTEAWSLSAAVDYARDNYNQSELGLVDSKIQSYTLDAVYAPSPLWSTYAYYSFENLTSDQNGHSFSNLITAFDPNRDWFVNHRDRVDSYGLGYKRSTASGHVDFGIDYLHSKSRSKLDFAVGSALLTKPLPPNATRLDSLDLFATYKLRQNWSLRTDLWYESYHSTDWALDGIAPNTLANVILLGETSPDYNVYVVSLSAIYRF